MEFRFEFHRFYIKILEEQHLVTFECLPVVLVDIPTDEVDVILCFEDSSQGIQLYQNVDLYIEDTKIIL